PPWARQPSTSYCPPTRSPGRSFGVKENRVPHLGQNPSVRPGRSPRPRPTGSPQLLQKRLPSATCGSDSTAVDGSRYGTRGTSTSPAPSIPRRPDDRVDPVRVVPDRKSTRLNSSHVKISYAV